MSQLDLAAEAGVGEATLRALETARRTSFSAVTLARIARALGWTPDSPHRILAGDDPVLAEDDEPRRPTGDGDVLAMIADIMDRLTTLEEIIGVRRALDRAEVEERAERNRRRRQSRAGV